MKSCNRCGRPCSDDVEGVCGLCEKLRYEAQLEALGMKPSAQEPAVRAEGKPSGW